MMAQVVAVPLSTGPLTGISVCDTNFLYDKVLSSCARMCAYKQASIHAVIARRMTSSAAQATLQACLSMHCHLDSIVQEQDCSHALVITGVQPEMHVNTHMQVSQL